MPDGGTRSVRATVTPAPSTNDIVEQAPIGEELTVAVSYSGNGIALDEPVKRGRQKLALSTCERIIEAHRGRMKAEDQPGQGATFHLPLATK